MMSTPESTLKKTIRSENLFSFFLILKGVKINMREIKFRGLRTNTKEWVYGGFVKILDECFIVTFKRGLSDRDGEMTSIIKVIPETVGQYLEFKDKNKKEIYEGDIVECSRYKTDDRFEVIVEDIRVRYDWMVGSNLNWRKVIGNKHQNPELLK